MALNLVKLCVGVEKIEQLAKWQEMRAAERRRAGIKPLIFHVTRMVPRRKAELLDGGSLFWVIKGNIQVRQRLLDVDPFTDEEGIRRCRLVLHKTLEPTVWQPKRAFQGWRYLEEKDSPADLKDGGSQHTDLSPEMRQELAELGLL